MTLEQLIEILKANKPAPAEEIIFHLEQAALCSQYLDAQNAMVTKCQTRLAVLEKVAKI